MTDTRYNSSLGVVFVTVLVTILMIVLTTSAWMMAHRAGGNAEAREVAMNVTVSCFVLFVGMMWVAAPHFWVLRELYRRYHGRDS